MRRVTLGGTGIETSALGFGCASLGSRVEAAAGARALAEAFEGGVTWFDLAPVYGDGAAEAVAAPFLRAHRAEVQICTKAGLGLAGGAGGGLRRTLMPLARRVVAVTGPLAGALRRAAPQANAKLPLTPALIEGSLEASLRRLGTDHVDLFALHAPAAAEVAREDILRTLEAIRAAGKARAVAVAGDEGAAAAALAAGAPYGAVQLALPPPGPGTDADAGALVAAQAAGFGTIVHSVVASGAGALRRRMADPGVAARLAAAGEGGGEDPARALAALLMRRAFALNPGGVVLVSMFSAPSRAANLAAAARPPGLGDPLAPLLAAG